MNVLGPMREFRPPIVAYPGIIGIVQSDEFQLLLIHLSIRGDIGFPENLFADSKATPLF